jgi:import inner membrane translocase subunit TIM44
VQLGAISSRLARQLADSTAPVRNTEAYKELSKTLADAFDDGGSALRIHADGAADAREVRRIKREARLRTIGRQPPRADVEGEEAIAKAMAPREEEVEEPVAAATAAGAAAGAESAKQASEQADAEGQPEGAAAAASAAAPGPAPSPQPHKPRPLGFAARVRSVQENAAAGEALVLRPEPAYKQAWASFRETNPLMRKLGEMRMAYDESENPVVERLRSITDTIGGWFQENETARVVAAFKALDPTFTLEGFQRELREYVVPEVIDAYHGAARHLLRQWCGEATYNVLMATIDPYVQKGAIAHGRLLDLKNIEILQARLLENNVPVVVVSFTSQELMYFKDAKTGEVMAGREDQADMCRYAMVLTRVEEEMDNEITGGWKVVEVSGAVAGRAKCCGASC